MNYRLRTVDAEIDELLKVASALAIDGPKGVGKSATAMQRAGRAWFLDDADQRAQLEADPHFRSAPAGCLLIDEWQRLPSVWDAVRRQVDAGAPPGRFLLTGSATPRAGIDRHSGAGRILSLRMRPMALHERGATTPVVSLGGLLAGSHAPIVGTTDWSSGDYYQAITASGFPGIFPVGDRLRRALLDAYVQHTIDRDLPEQGLVVRRPDTLRRWLAAYAAASSTTTKYNEILDATTAGDGSQPAKSTTVVYRDLLTQLWILDPVPGWIPTYNNPLGRLQQAAKHQLADPALAARLLAMSASVLAAPKGATMAGRLFESLATLTVRVAAQAAEATVGHLRTASGDREVDLIVTGPEGQVLGIEVKLAGSVADSDVRHLHWLRERMGDDVVDLMVVTTGSAAYRRPDGVAVVPLALLGP